MSHILRNTRGNHTSVAVRHGSPFMHEDHPRVSVSVNIKRAVDSVPVFRRNTAAGNIFKRSQRIVGTVYRNHTVIEYRRIYGSKYVKIPFIKMTFRRPENVLYSMKIFRRVKNHNRFRPMFKIVPDKTYYFIIFIFI